MLVYLNIVNVINLALKTSNMHQNIEKPMGYVKVEDSWTSLHFFPSLIDHKGTFIKHLMLQTLVDQLSEIWGLVFS